MTILAPVRATAHPSRALAVAPGDTPVSPGVDLPPDPSRDYFPGLTGPIDFVLLDAHLLFTRPPVGAETLSQAIERIAG